MNPENEKPLQRTEALALSPDLAVVRPEITGEIRRDASGRFVPGCSGNPQGRPRGSLTRPFTDLCCEIFEENREAIKQQIIRTLTSPGIAGVVLLRLIWERMEGKVTQRVDINRNLDTLTDEQLQERLQQLLGLTPKDR